VIDKRSGRQIHAVNDLSIIRNFSVEADPETQVVSVKTNGHAFRIRFTDQPVEEARPVQIKAEETAGDKVRKGLNKMAEAILDAITEKSPRPEPPPDADPHRKTGEKPVVPPQPRSKN